MLSISLGVPYFTAPHVVGRSGANKLGLFVVFCPPDTDSVGARSVVQVILALPRKRSDEEHLAISHFFDSLKELKDLAALDGDDP